MKGTLRKLGYQSADDPLDFVLSTDVADRHGDIVEQAWRLAEFRRNPIALFGHWASQPIGTWSHVRVEGGRLLGRLQLAAAGTSKRIDEVRSLVEQRILRAVSVGFIPHKRTPLDPDKPWGAMRLADNELLECSLVAIPANPQAVQLTYRSLPAGARALLRDATVADDWPRAAVQLDIQPRASGDPPSPQSRNPTMRTLADKIAARRAELTERRAQLETLIRDHVGDDGTLDEVTNEAAQELREQIDQAERALGTLVEAERALGARAVAAGDVRQAGEQAGAAAGDGGEPLPVRTMRRTPPPAHRAIAAIACALAGHSTKRNPIEIAQRAYGAEREIEIIVRAATAPATMTDPAWAAALVRDTWGEFLDLIRGMSIYPGVPGIRADFDRFGKLILPRNDGRGRLAGGFVAEGAPIPVKQGVIGSVDLTPRKMAVISTFTKEIGRHSLPAIEELIRAQILGDTAEALDAAFLSNAPRNAIQPAGLQDPTETGAPNIVASTGATVAQILADVTGVLGRAMAARAATGGQWQMNPLRVLGLRNKQDAASGAFPFRAEVDAGTFSGYPLAVSENVPPAVVSFVGGRAMVFGNDYAPLFDVSDETTLHMEDTDPLPITEPGAPPVVAAPVRSMFQTDSVAIKMTTGLDWRIARVGGVQVLTGVAW